MAEGGSGGPDGPIRVHRKSGRYSHGRGGGGCGGGIHRTKSGSLALRLDHDRRWLDDRLGHLHRLGRYRAPRGLAGALAYGELAAMMPQAGGQYVYLREAYGGMPAFLFGWTLLLVIQTGTI